MNHFLTRREFLAGAAATAISVNLGQRVFASNSEEPLIVGGLPVTCNLTLPIACSARADDIKAGRAKGPLFEYSKYNGWPEIKESLMTGRIQAAYMLAPLIMDLSTKKIPVKIVSLGHRSGAVIMVRKDSNIKSFMDLKKKRVAIPSRFAVDFLFLRKMLAKEGMSAKDIEIIEMPPPDMPAALYAKAVDAYCTGEPFGAAAEKAGYAVPLRLTRDEWPTYICCVLTVREELIQKNRPLVQDLVNYVAGAGHWLDKTPANRDIAAGIAAQRKYFNQDKKIIQYVMENPKDRVTYGDMRMLKHEFDDLMKLSRQAETISQDIPFEKYADLSFYKAVKPVALHLTAGTK